jgi:hypothetical protein
MRLRRACGIKATGLSVGRHRRGPQVIGH